MTSSLDFTTATADLLTQELDKVVFSGLEAGEGLMLTTTVYDGGGSVERDSWTSTYYADEDGKVTVSSLARMWNSYILDEAVASPSIPLGGIVVQLDYELDSGGNGSCQRRLWYCRRKTGATLSSLASGVPFLSRKRTTMAGASEPVVVACPSGVTLHVAYVYVLAGEVEVGSTTISFSSSNDYLAKADVSPAVVAALLPSGGVLMEYDVIPKVSGNSHPGCKYVMDGQHPYRTQLCYLNNYGAWETIALDGIKDMKLERTAERNDYR